MFVHRHSDGKDQFDAVMAAVKGVPEMVALGKDGRGEERFTSRAMTETEPRLECAADRLTDRARPGLPAALIRGAITAAGSKRRILCPEQEATMRHTKGEREP